MSTIVCNAKGCPNCTSSGFCSKNIVIIKASGSVLQCSTGLNDIYEAMTTTAAVVKEEIDGDRK